MKRARLTRSKLERAIAAVAAVCGAVPQVVIEPDGTIRIYCKGSDAKVMARIRDDTDPDLVTKTNNNLHLFAKQVG